MEKIGFFVQLSSEISNMNLSNFIFVAIFFYVPFYFSKKAQTLFFHLLYSYFALYMLFTIHGTSIIYNGKLLVGLGLLIPQLRFIIQFIKDIIQTVKMMTTNTYYFFVTIYYKIIRFINWIKSTYIMLKTFFTTFSFKKENYQEHSYEQKYQKSNYKEETKSESNYKEQSYSKKEEPKSEHKKEYGKFERFYSDSAYVVLGVSADDDLKAIKKVYRKLVREYHPDLNPDNIEFYTEITQNINNAWEKVEKWKKWYKIRVNVSDCYRRVLVSTLDYKVWSFSLP